MKKITIPRGWLGIKYNANPKVGEFYITSKGFVNQCTVKGEAVNKTIVKRLKR